MLEAKPSKRDIHREANIYDFLPAITMRPHHFVNDFVAEALVPQGRSPEKLADLWAESHLTAFVKHGDSNGYFNDVIGKTRGTYFSFKLGLARYFHKLRDLSGTDFIQFDLSPDGVCGSCNVGNHCTGINYEPNPKIITGPSDLRAVKSILDKLKINGFKEGIHFQTDTKMHTVVDFEKHTLDNPPNKGGVTVSFPSVTARVDALRHIAG